MLDLLNELEQAGITRNKEQSAKMLRNLLATAPRLVRSYPEPIIKVFLPKLSDHSQSVVTPVLAAIGEQASVCGLEMRKWIDKLFPIILDAIQDSSSNQKREAALWALGQLVENSGYVVEPYWKYPSLLDILFDLLKSEQTKKKTQIRIQVIRVLGLIGAVDPYRHKVNLGVIDQSGEPSCVSDDIEQGNYPFDN